MNGLIDINNMSKSDVEKLIHDLKHPSKVFEIRDIQNKLVSLPIGGKYKKDTLILGTIDNIEYKLHIYISPYFDVEKRYSIHLRLASNNEHLVRVDVGSGHKNPKGYPDCSHVDHIHFYQSDITPHDAIAYPLSEVNFPNINSITEAFDNFLEYTNISYDNQGGEINESN